jgi:hypothetical protein
VGKKLRDLATVSAAGVGGLLWVLFRDQVSDWARQFIGHEGEPMLTRLVAKLIEDPIAAAILVLLFPPILLRVIFAGIDRYHGGRKIRSSPPTTTIPNQLDEIEELLARVRSVLLHLRDSFAGKIEIPPEVLELHDGIESAEASCRAIDMQTARHEMNKLEDAVHAAGSRLDAQTHGEMMACISLAREAWDQYNEARSAPQEDFEIRRTRGDLKGDEYRHQMKHACDCLRALRRGDMLPPPLSEDERLAWNAFFRLRRTAVHACQALLDSPSPQVRDAVYKQSEDLSELLEVEGVRLGQQEHEILQRAVVDLLDGLDSIVVGNISRADLRWQRGIQRFLDAIKTLGGG